MRENDEKTEKGGQNKKKKTEDREEEGKGIRRRKEEQKAREMGYREVARLKEGKRWRKSE